MIGEYSHSVPLNYNSEYRFASHTGGGHLKLPEFIRWKIPVKYEKQRIDPAAFHRISCSRVGALSSIALFRCIFSFGMFFGFTQLFFRPCLSFNIDLNSRLQLHRKPIIPHNNLFKPPSCKTLVKLGKLGILLLDELA